MITDRKKVLVCVMDWGLGHATRSIPVILALQQRHCEVFLASSGSALTLLQQEFPELHTFPLAAYAPHYRGKFLFAMCRQLPHFLHTIHKEYHETQAIVRRHGIEVILSDNRYGCHHPTVKSVIMTHQVNIQLPAGGALVNFFNHRALRKFSSCWIPDVQGDRSLGGKLSLAPDGHFSCIGHLSRFQHAAHATTDHDIDILGIVSGPEPQRTIFEQLLTEALRKSGKKYRVVGGIPIRQAQGPPIRQAQGPPIRQAQGPPIRQAQGSSVRQAQGPFTADFLDATALNQVINRAAVVICRPGYSSIMDLAKLNKRAIFVPTPGQTEQEYLASRLMEKGIAFAVTQKNFDLDIALQESTRFRGFENLFSDGLNEAVDSFLS